MHRAPLCASGPQQTAEHLGFERRLLRCSVVVAARARRLNKFRAAAEAARDSAVTLVVSSNRPVRTTNVTVNVKIPQNMTPNTMSENSGTLP